MLPPSTIRLAPLAAEYGHICRWMWLAPLGRFRVHCWSATTPGEYRAPVEIIERAKEVLTPPRGPILPPLAPPQPAWRTEPNGARSLTDDFLATSLLESE